MKFVTGTLILLVGALVCKIIGAVYRIPLSNVIGVEGLGIYQLIFPIYSLFLMVISGGISVALSKIVAEERANGNFKNAKKYLKVSVLSVFLISLTFSIIFYFCSGVFASFQGNEKAELGYRAVSFALLFAGLIPCFRGFFQGFENMLPTVLSQIFEQVSKVLFGLWLGMVLLPHGVEFAVLGTILGVSIGEFLSLAYLLIRYLISRKKTIPNENNEKVSSNFGCLKKIYKLSLPITLNSIIMPMILALDSVLIVNLLSSASGFTSGYSTSLYGVYSGVVNSLINFPSVFAIAIATAIVPSISFSISKGKESNKSIALSLKIVFLICLPCFFVFLIFAPEIVKILFPKNLNSFPDFLFITSSLLRLCSINVCYISLIYLSSAILQAYGKAYIPLFSLLFSGIVRVLFTVFLVSVPGLNIFGAVYASLIGFGLCSTFNIFKLKKISGFQIQKKEAFSMVSTCVIFGISLALFKMVFVDFNLVVNFLTSVCFSSVIFVLLIILMPTFSKSEYEFIPFGNKINYIRQKTFNKMFKKNFQGNNFNIGGNDE